MPRWRIIGASVVGTSHVRVHRGCDDAHGWLCQASGITVLAVADGAGSRDYSGIGAHIAIATVLAESSESTLAATALSDPVSAITVLFEHAVSAIEREASDMKVLPPDLATTLCVALLTPQGVAIGQIGDGIAVVEDVAVGVRAVAIADRSEYANETVFLTSEGLEQHLKVFHEEKPTIRSVALSTDGLRYRALDRPATGEPYVPFFLDSWAYSRSADPSSEAVERFLDGLDDQSGDDKTLVLAVFEPDGEAVAESHITPRPSGPVYHETGAVDA